jgi:L-ectoine synthase
MFVRSLADVERAGLKVEWGAGTSHRMLTADDGMGYTICRTVVRAGSESLLQYRNHLEACYCIAGRGEVEDMQGRAYRIGPGDVYVLDQHDQHYLRADGDGDMVLLSVFNPPLRGDERHNLQRELASSY